MNTIKFDNLFQFQKKSKIKAGDGFKLGEAKYPFYTSSNVLTKTIDEYLFEAESLIFGTGGLASIHFCNIKFAVSTDCFVTQPKNVKDVFCKYVYYYLSGNIHILENGFKGAGLKHISKDYLANIQIPLPPLPTQQKIASILDAADTLRQKDKALLAKYDELTQALFLDMFGDPVKNEKGWDEVKLGNVCDVGSSKRVFVDELVEDGIPFYRGTEVGKLGEGKSITPTLFITKEHYERLKKQRGIPKKGDLLMPSICPDGRIWAVDNDAEFYFKDGRVLWIELNTKKMNSIYLKYHLKGSFFANYNNIASGTTFAELKIVALKKMGVLYPNLKLQNQFAERVAIIEKQKAIAQTSLEKSEELFNSLLQKAFKGELV
jgi:type I restriction enzyme S subunit